MENKREFEGRKKSALNAARAQGIVDVVTADREGKVSTETVELAAKLMKKHGKTAYERLESRRKSQT